MLSLLLGVRLGVGLGWFALKLRLGWEFQSGLGSSGGGVWSWGFFWIVVVRVLVVALVGVYGQGWGEARA